MVTKALAGFASIPSGTPVMLTMAQAFTEEGIFTKGVIYRPFFQREEVECLAKGYDVLVIDEFEGGAASKETVSCNHEKQSVEENNGKNRRTKCFLFYTQVIECASVSP